MSQADYSFDYYNCQGEFKFSFEGILEATFGRLKNEVGLCEITLPAELYQDSDFIIDNQLLIKRRNENTGVYEVIGQTKWFLQKIVYLIDEQCVENIELTFEDNIGLLRRRVTPWFQEDQTNTPSGAALLEADDLMLSIFNWNFGVNVDGSIPGLAPNQITYGVAAPPGAVDAIYGSIALRNQHRPFPIQTAGYESLAGPVTTNYELITVLDAFLNIAALAKANNDNLWFDIVYNEVVDTYTFDTWVGIRGNDLSSTFIVSPEHLNLVNATYTIDATNSCDIAYVSGSGQGLLQRIGSASEGLQESKPFAPRECIVNDSQLDTQERVDARALVELINRRVNPVVEGEILNIPQSQLFVDFNYGDVVRVEWRSFSYFAEIDEFSVSLTSDGEEIETSFTELREFTQV